MSYLREESKGSKTVCQECGSELIVDLAKCPICGEDLPGEGVNSKAEADIKKKMTLLYNLVFWAEEMDLDTLGSYKMIRQARDELKVGDLEEAKRFLKNALDEIFKPLINSLEEDMSKEWKGIKKSDISGENIIQLRSFLKKAVDCKEEGRSYQVLILLNEYRKKIERYRSV
ncbi:MAG: hypothetical protein R6W73_01475 [Candidatus Saliniplasma sp.]